VPHTPRRTCTHAQACDNAAIGVNDWLAEAFATDPAQVAPITPTKLPDFPVPLGECVFARWHVCVASRAYVGAAAGVGMGAGARWRRSRA